MFGDKRVIVQMRIRAIDPVDLLALPEGFAPPLDLPAEANIKLKLRLLGQLFDLGKVAPKTAKPRAAPEDGAHPLGGVMGCTEGEC